VFGRLAGYEDVNDAERLYRDPAMRWVVGDRAITGSAAASQMGRFETKWLCRRENLTALADLPGHWTDKVQHRQSPRIIVLDMDSSGSPTFGEQEGSAYNGHFGCTCYHPLFVFNQFGDVERCDLQPGNVHSADWRAVLEPVAARYRESVKRLYFRGDAAFANLEMCRFLETEGAGYTIRLPANNVLQNRIRYLLKRPAGRPPREVRRTIRASPIRRRAGASRVASWPRSNGIRASYTRVSASSHQPGAAGRASRRLLQPARHSGAVDQGRQGRDQMDAAVVSNVRRQCRASPAACAGLHLGNFMRTLAMPKAAQPWSLTSLRENLIKIGAKVVSHGRYVWFQMAEVAVPRQMFAEILSLIGRLRAPPAPA
jgi:hypothetical protein